MGSIPTRSRLVRISPPSGGAARLRTLGLLALLIGGQPLDAQERPPPAAPDSAAVADTAAALDSVPARAAAAPDSAAQAGAVPDSAAQADAVPDSAAQAGAVPDSAAQAGAVPDSAAAAALPDTAADDGIPDAAVVTQAADLPQSDVIAQQQAQPPVTPMGAFVRSLFVPGWGQAAVEQPGRGAFYFFAQTFFVTMAIRSQGELDAAKRAMPEDPELVDSKKSQRETWVVLAVFTALFSAVDAWVSAHLWDFEGEIAPPEDGTPGVQVQVPVGGP